MKVMCCIFRYRLSLLLHGDATELFDQMGLASALEGDSSQCIVRYHMYDVFFTFPTHQQLKSDRIHMICPKCFLIIFPEATEPYQVCIAVKQVMKSSREDEDRCGRGSSTELNSQGMTREEAVTPKRHDLLTWLPPWTE